MDERQVFDAFHEALDVQLPRGAFRRLEAALTAPRVRRQSQLARVRLWQRPHLRIEAAMILVAVVAAALGVVWVAHRPLSQSVPVVAPHRGTIVFARVMDTNGDELLFTIRGDGSDERALLATTTGCCGGVKWSHKGDRLQLLISAPAPHQNLSMTSTIRVDGSGYRVLASPVPGLFLGPGAWSPDDSRLALEGIDPTDPSRDGVYTADSADGRNLVRVTATGDEDIPVAYSPDGSKILFWSALHAGADDGRLFVVGVDGSHLVQVNPPGTTSWFKAGDPGGWSPDGSHISFAAFSPTATDPGRSAVFVAAGDGTNAKQISDWGTYTTSARWSPTSDWLLFDKAVGLAGDHSFFVIHPDGSGAHQVGSVNRVCCAVWAPDGGRFAFKYGPSDSTSDLWTMTIDGSHLDRLTHAPASLDDVQWSASP